MEQAVLRSSGGKKSYFPLVIGEQVLIGPHAYLSGCKVENNVFFAAASKAYNGAVIGEVSIIAIGGIVHVNAQLPKESRVPIYNIAFGNPARICSPNEVEEIGKQLQNIDFLSTVFQIPQQDNLTDRLALATKVYSKSLKGHIHDCLLNKQ